jgi:hypothetical protein
MSELDEVLDAYYDERAKGQAAQLVTVRLPPAWYHVLLSELAFAMNAQCGWGEHHPDNARKLYEMVVKQGGAKGAN